MSNIADVAIVGYGPVGQALALGLAQHGHKVIVIERWPSLYALPRAVTYDHEVARFLQSLGIADDMSRHTATSERYEWRNSQGELLAAFVGLDQIALSGWPDRIGFYQPGLETTLDAHLRSGGLNVTIVQGWTVTSVQPLDDSVVLQAHPTHDSNAPSRQYRARYVVGCDGAESFIRQAMGTSYEDLGFSADWLVVDVLPKDPADWNSNLVQVCDPARPTTLVSGGPGRRRLEFMLLSGESKETMNNADAIWKLLTSQGWTPANADLERHAVYTFRGCVAQKWRSGRMMLAGDAAHLTPPFAGQGLCAGLRDAAGLIWRLHEILRGASSAEILDSYETERRPHVRRFIEFAIELGKIICELNPAAAAARDAAMLDPKNQHQAEFPDPRLGASALQQPNDPHAGNLSLQGWVKAGGQTGRFDDIVGRGFTLLALDSDPRKSLSEDELKFMESINAHLVGIGQNCPIEDIDGDYRRWFTELEARFVLIRPDFYLYGCSNSASTLVRGLQHNNPWKTIPIASSVPG